jgi:hypothetical protein
MPQNKNSGAWPSNPHPEAEIAEDKEGSIDIDDRDEGYQVASQPGQVGSDDDTLEGAAADDDDTLDLDDEGDESEDDGGYQAAEPPSPPAPAPGKPAKKSR